MPVSLVIGGQWGDEGKAKIVDNLARRVDYVVRFQGGANAGHTVMVGDERFKFHLIPAGILYPHLKCVLGGGMVIDPLSLCNEIDEVVERGIAVEDRILISEQAHVVLPYHIAMDSGDERRQGKRRIGSTKKGIMPAYRDKVGRSGMRMVDFLLDRQAFTQSVRKRIRARNIILTGQGFDSVPVKETIERFLEARDRLRPLICDTRLVLWDAFEKKKSLLYEGAQGTMLDIDHGTYPFVTSSSVTASGAAAGSGLPPSVFRRVIGVFKGYCTRVGNGPFPTEQRGRVGDRLREIGGEYGTTTGRPRRCGWFDAVAARTSIKLNGITEIALTKLDVLDSFKTIKVCTSYQAGKRTFEYFPVDTRLVERCRPRYMEIEGWNSETGPDLKRAPRRALAYVRTLEKLLGCRVSMISFGPQRRATLRVKR